MGLTNSVTFNVCNDNAAAADALVDALKGKGYKAERLEVPAEAHAHAEAQGVPSPLAAVAHDAPPDVVHPLMIEIEGKNAPAPRDARDFRDDPRNSRPSSSSPTAPFGGPDPRDPRNQQR